MEDDARTQDEKELARYHRGALSYFENHGTDTIFDPKDPFTSERKSTIIFLTEVVRGQSNKVLDS